MQRQGLARQNEPVERGQPDFIIMIIVFLLLGIGLVMVYSSSQVTAYLTYGDSSHYFRRQLIWASAGLILLYITMNIPYAKYQKVLPLLLFSLFLMMILVPTSLGVSEGGAQRWLNLGFVSIQPSEFVKIGIIIYLASLYSKKQEYIDQFWRGVAPPLFVVGVFFGLILIQRDLGTAMMIVMIAVIILFCSGARFKHMFALALTTGSLFVIFSFIQPYRLQRLISYRDPWADPLGDGYQLIQSLYAIGNGGIFGTGFGNSLQKYAYLPAAHTDFILSIIAEEMGLVGIAVIIFLYTVLILRGIKVSTQAPDSFGILLGLGIISMLGIQSLVNIGVVSGVLPITGITLPFISYGGSSLWLTMISMGVLLNISRYMKNSPPVKKSTPVTNINQS